MVKAPKVLLLQITSVVWISLVWGIALIYEQGGRFAPMLAPFTLAMALQGILHWFAPWLGRRWYGGLCYLISQIFLVIGTSYVMTHSVGVGCALSLALMAEAPVIFGRGAFVACAIACYSAAIVLIIWLLERKDWGISATNASLGFLPLLIVLIVLLVQQVQGRETARAALQQVEAVCAEERLIAQERQRMARELHDTLAQGLAGIILQLEAVAAHIDQDEPHLAQEVIAHAMIRGRSSLTEVRQAIMALRDETPAHRNLLEAVETEINRCVAIHGLTCELIARPLPNLPLDTQMTIIHVVREGVTNVVRHARATQAWITLTHEKERVLVEIRDNGCGFDPQTSIGASGHFGLQGLRERVQAAAGSLTISCPHNSGTVLTVSLPIQRS